MFNLITKEPETQQQTSEIQQLIVDFMYETFINNYITTKRQNRISN